MNQINELLVMLLAIEIPIQADSQVCGEGPMKGPNNKPLKSLSSSNVDPGNARENAMSAQTIELSLSLQRKQSVMLGGPEGK